MPDAKAATPEEWAAYAFLLTLDPWTQAEFLGDEPGVPPDPQLVLDIAAGTFVPIPPAGWPDDPPPGWTEHPTSVLPVTRPRRKATIPAALRWEVWERDDFRCRRCGARRFLEVDHVHPEALGGATTLDNLQTLCHPCNADKGARP